MIIGIMQLGAAIVTSTLIVVVGAIILVPILLRHRLAGKQLDTVTTAINNGVEPERALAGIDYKQRGDINGNWKAGFILTFVGFIICAFLFLAAANNPEMFGLWIVCLIFPLTGIALLIIHKRVVGKVKKLNELADDGSSESKPPTPPPAPPSLQG